MANTDLKSIKSQLTDSDIDKLLDIAQQVSDSPEIVVQIARRNKIVIDNFDDPMQKFAFTVITEMCSLSLKVQQWKENIDARTEADTAQKG